jgi:hypothetical protein
MTFLLEGTLFLFHAKGQDTRGKDNQFTGMWTGIVSGRILFLRSGQLSRTQTVSRTLPENKRRTGRKPPGASRPQALLPGRPLLARLGRME